MRQDGKKRPRAAAASVNALGEDAGGSRSVRRALEIFEFLLQLGGPTTIGEIVSALQIPKSTAYELVRIPTKAEPAMTKARSMSVPPQHLQGLLRWLSHGWGDPTLSLRAVASERR